MGGSGMCIGKEFRKGERKRKKEKKKRKRKRKRRGRGKGGGEEKEEQEGKRGEETDSAANNSSCLLHTSDAADDLTLVVPPASLDCTSVYH